MQNAKNILQFDPISKFLAATGKDIEQYLGKDKGALVYLKPDGVWYAEGLYQWLKGRGRDVTLTTMEDDGEGLEEGKVRGRKVLIVDNDIVTGKGYKRSMEALRVKKAELGVKGIKFAAFFDRPGLADFAVERYHAESIWRMNDLDAPGLKIIQYLGENGRASLAEIGKKVHLSPVAVKHRVDRLLQAKILKVEGRLVIDQFYSLSAHVHVEAEGEALSTLAERLVRARDVCHLAQLAGGNDLAVCILGHNLEDIEEFVESNIRAVPGVRRLEVRIAGLPLKPRTIPPKL